MKNIDKKIIGFSIVLIFLIILSKNLDSLSLIKNINYTFILPLIGISAILLVFNGLLIKFMLEIFNVNLSFNEYFGLGLVTTIGNYILPLRGGASIRAIYLKKKYDFPYPQFGATLIGTYAILFIAYGSIGLLTGILSKTSFSLNLFFFSMIIFPVIIFLAHLKTRIGIIDSIFVGLEKIRRSNKFYKVFSLMIFDAVFRIILMILLFESLQIQSSPGEIILITISAVFSMFINLLPANIGLREMIITSTTQIYGISLSEGVAIALGFRAIEMITLTIFSPIAYLFIKKHAGFMWKK